ncbi:MAG: AraC family ligand binding domain-containing protein, partial [Clostridia bacterium]|nr:AraC family ligand binding domain-containing protein [Clostridia bacterium]
MNNEFIIDINGFKTKIYMQIGFFDHKDLCSPLHKHLFVEMHIFLSGTAIMQCDKEDILLQEGDVLFIPANMSHKYQSFKEGSKRISFLLDCNSHCKSPNKSSLPITLLSLLCKEIQDYALIGRDSKLKALLSYICSDFLIIEAEKTKIPITNREL